MSDPGRNWCEIPPEIQMKCIENMDFRTRNMLRRASKADKSLVESKKYHFDEFFIRVSGEITRDPFQYSVYAINETLNETYEHCEVAREESEEKRTRFVDFVMRTCEVDKFFVDSNYECPPTEPAPLFRCKKLSVGVDDWPTIRYFLDRCHPPEILDLSCNMPLREAAAHPTVFNATKIVFGQCDRDAFEAACSIIRRWIETNADTEKSLRLTSNERAVDMAAHIFSDRIVDRDEYKVIIRMDDPTKHVLIRNADPNFAPFEYIKCRVIPAGQPESEYSELTDIDQYFSLPESRNDSGSENLADANLLDLSADNEPENFMNLFCCAFRRFW